LNVRRVRRGEIRGVGGGWGGEGKVEDGKDGVGVDRDRYRKWVVGKIRGGEVVEGDGVFSARKRLPFKRKSTRPTTTRR